MSRMSHKEMTKHIRGRIKAMHIPARVQLYTSCGYEWIRILPPTADGSFTAQQARDISICAKANRLTEVMGGEIDDSIARWTDSGATNFHFVYPAPAAVKAVA